MDQRATKARLVAKDQRVTKVTKVIKESRETLARKDHKGLSVSLEQEVQLDLQES